MPVVPVTDGSVGAEQEHAGAAGDEADEGHDESDAPGLVRAHALAGDERVEDGRHDEVGDATAGVAPATGQGVGRADDVLVKPGGAQHLAGHERSAQDADEEPGDVQAGRGLDERREADGQAADEQKRGKDLASAKHVAERAGDEAEEQRRAEGDDVGVGDFGRAEVKVLFDGDRQQRRERVPVMHLVSHNAIRRLLNSGGQG